MDIRILESNDVRNHHDSVFELLKICFESTYSNEISAQFIETKINGLIEYIDSGKAYTFGAFINGSLIAFLWGYPVDTPTETVFHIAYIAVKEKGRRRGIGEKLIIAAENETRELGLNHIELIVGAENNSALDFYGYCGYKPDRYYLRKEVR